jgi:simple sugar transport system permease protein
MGEFFTQDYLIGFAFSVIRMSTPLIFCAMGALISMHAGQINMAMEGILLSSSLIGVMFSAWTQSLWGGVLGAVVGGIVISLIMGYMNIIIDADMMLTGVSLNQLAAGGTIYVLFAVMRTKSSTQGMPSLVFPTWDIPLIKDIPILGRIISGHNELTYIAFLVAFLTWFFVFRTKTGLRIRAIGFNPNSAASVGINVKRVKFSAFIYSGIFAALGGAFMSMGYLSYWAQNMTAGRGFIGISATNLASGNVLLSVVAAMFFGLFYALSISLQTMNYRILVVQMLPYLATVFGLVILSIFRDKKAQAKRRGR